MRQRAGYTMILVGDDSRPVRKLHFDARHVRHAVIALVGTALLGIAFAAHYATLLAARRGDPDRALREENAALRVRLHGFEERVAHIAETLDRVDQADTRLRATVKQLEPAHAASGSRASGGPAVQPAAGHGQGEREPSSMLLPPGAGASPARVASLESAAQSQVMSLESLQEYFATRRAMLATTPAGWPTRGTVTSDFGERLDPYTAERMMHRGLDIATARGQPVVAPSDGTVTFAGTENGYGKVVVLDHGQGVNTTYAHLSRIDVKPGQSVKRGARVAEVGNTGRSTGPHLHYEVRVNGTPENPRKFLLE